MIEESKLAELRAELEEQRDNLRKEISVQGGDPDSDDAAIVASIIALGQTLNMYIVAEGVETAAQRSLLTELGCHILQGYLLGKPMPAPLFCETVAMSHVAPRAI